MLNVLRSLVREATVLDSDYQDLGVVEGIEITADAVFIILADTGDDGDPDPEGGEEVPVEHTLPEQPAIPDVPGTPPENVHSIRRKTA